MNNRNNANLAVFRYVAQSLKSPLPKACDTSVSIPPQRPISGANKKKFTVRTPRPTPDIKTGSSRYPTNRILVKGTKYSTYKDIVE